MAKLNLIDVPGFEITDFLDYGNPWGGVTKSVYTDGDFLVFEVVLASDTPGFLYGAQSFSVGAPLIGLEVIGGDFSYDGLPVQGSPTGGALAELSGYPPDTFLVTHGGALTEVPRLPDGSSGAPQWHSLHGGVAPFPLLWDGAPAGTTSFDLGVQARRGFTSGGPVTARLRLHIEAEYEAPPDPDPDPPSQCFWTDLVNVQQHCTPAPEPPGGEMRWYHTSADNGRLFTNAEVPAHRAPPAPGPGETLDDLLVPSHDAGYGGTFVFADGSAVLVFPALVTSWNATRLRVDNAGIYRIRNDGVGQSPWPDDMGDYELVQALPRIEGYIEVPPNWVEYGLRGRFVMPLPALPVIEEGYFYVLYADDMSVFAAPDDEQFEEVWNPVFAPIIHTTPDILAPTPALVTTVDDAIETNIYVVGARARARTVYDETTWEPTDWLLSPVVAGLHYAQICFEYEVSVAGADPFEGYAPCS